MVSASLASFSRVFEGGENVLAGEGSQRCDVMLCYVSGLVHSSVAIFFLHESD